MQYLGILKKLVENFKQASIHHEARPVLKEAIVVLLRYTANPETLRFTALYITSSLHSPARAESDYQPTKLELPLSKAGSNDAICGPEVGLTVLQAYTSFLCMDSAEFVHKFVKTVTNKVYFIELSNMASHAD